MTNLVNDSQLSRIAEVVLAVIEARKRVPDDLQGQSFFGEMDLWMFIAIADDRICMRCDVLNFTVWKGTELRSMFDWLTILDGDTIMPNVHQNCRCELVRITEPATYIDLT